MKVQFQNIWSSRVILGVAITVNCRCCYTPYLKVNRFDSVTRNWRKWIYMYFTVFFVAAIINLLKQKWHSWDTYFTKKKWSKFYVQSLGNMELARQPRFNGLTFKCDLDHGVPSAHCLTLINIWDKFHYSPSKGTEAIKWRWKYKSNY